MHSHGQLRRMRAKRDPSSCFPLSRVSFLFSLSLSLPTFLLLFAWRRQSLLVPSINIWKGKKKIFFSGRETKLGRGRRENVRFPPPVCSFFSWLPPTLCSHFWSPKVTAGRNYTFAVNLEAFAASGYMVTATDHAARLLPPSIFSLLPLNREERKKSGEKQ